MAAAAIAVAVVDILAAAENAGYVTGMATVAEKDPAGTRLGTGWVYGDSLIGSRAPASTSRRLLGVRLSLFSRWQILRMARCAMVWHLHEPISSCVNSGPMA
jgi:hypothetical protein